MKSKEETLERTRRNQQRCRDRRRQHIAELEDQVTSLRTKLQGCEPCNSSPVPDETVLARLSRENDARRDLLLALGFDEELQKRFIARAEDRETVKAILGAVSDEGDVFDGLNRRGRFTRIAPAPPSQSPGQWRSDVMDLGGGGEPEIEQAESSLTDSLPHDSTAISSDQVVDLSNVFSPAAMDNTQDIFADLNLPWPVDASELPLNDQDGEAAQKCFLNTVIRVQPGEDSMPCSKALPWVLQNNVKGLTVAELQDRLRPGILCQAGRESDCRVKNSVLFKVLAEVAS